MAAFARVLVWCAWIFTAFLVVFAAFNSPPVRLPMGRFAVLFYGIAGFLMSLACGFLWLAIAFIRQPWINLPIYVVAMLAVLFTSIMGGTESAGAFLFFHTLGATHLLAFLPPLIPK